MMCPTAQQVQRAQRAGLGASRCTIEARCMGGLSIRSIYLRWGLTEKLFAGMLDCARPSAAERATTIFTMAPVTESSASCLKQRVAYSHRKAAWSRLRQPSNADTVNSVYLVY